MHFCVGAGEDLTLGIIQFEFDLQGAQRRVQGIRCSHDCGREGAVRVLRKSQRGFESWLGRRGERFRYPHKNAQFVRIGNAEQFRCRLLCPALISAPTSVLRAVMTPVKGATTRLNDSKSRSRATLAAAESAAAFLAAASPAFSSASCLDTDSVASSPCHRALVLLDRFSFARAVARSASACINCWSTSGVSISARAIGPW